MNYRFKALLADRPALDASLAAKRARIKQKLSFLKYHPERAIETIIWDCECINPGQDDGQTTCWVHHDCRDGSCTHDDSDY